MIAAIPSVLLLLASLFFCHRFYGIYFPFDPDVAQNLYFGLHKDLILADHNPFHWAYASYLPVSQSYNPFLEFISTLLNFFSNLSSIEKVGIGYMATGVCCLWLAGVSVYGLLRYTGKSRTGSLVGAVVASFTGYHVAFGVRQFDFFYLISFSAIGPLLICFDKICRIERPARWIILAALIIAVSLLGGTNVPLFFYLPLALFFPFAICPTRRKATRRFVLLVATTVLGVLGASAILIPGVVFLADTNRSHLVFHEKAFDTSFLEQTLAVFFRDWWGTHNIPGSATDFYFGLPTVLFFVWGAMGWWRNRREQRTNLFPQFFLVCLLVGFLIINFAILPAPARWLIERASGALSIRFPHRFFQLIILPVAYFAAEGFERGFSRMKGLALFTVCTLYFLLAGRHVFPGWQNLIPDMKMALAGSQIFAFGTLSLWLIAQLIKSKKKLTHLYSALTGAAIGCLYLMFCLAPIQLTSFSNFVYEERRIENGQRNIGLYYKGRFGLREFFGLRQNYSDTFRRISDRLTVPPPALRAPETRVGRIIERLSPEQKTPSYFAPVTGHHFMFTNVEDPASPKRMRELSEIRTEAILDMAGVCWGPLEIFNRSAEKVTKRPNCFPEASLVPQAKPFRSEQEELRWMAQASRHDFSQFVSLACPGGACPASLPVPSPPDFGKLSWNDSEPGHFSFRATLVRPGYLFLSTPYRFDWKSFINGVPGEVLRANHAFMAIPLKAGDWQVELTLDRFVTQYSRLATLFFFAGMAAWWVLEINLGRRRLANDANL